MVVEFQRWWVLKSNVKKWKKNLSMNVSWPKIGHNFRKWIGLKIEARKQCFHTKIVPEFKKRENNIDDFWHQKSTLKVRFWHFLTNCKSLMDFYSFDYVDAWTKILLLGTYHLWNSTTKLINDNSSFIVCKKFPHKFE